MIIPMDENEDFQHLEEMIANLQVKQKQILKGMLDYPIQIDSAIRILSDPSRQLVITHNNIRVRASQLGLTKGLFGLCYATDRIIRDETLIKKDIWRFLLIVFNLERTNQSNLLPDKDLVHLCHPIEPY